MSSTSKSNKNNGNKSYIASVMGTRNSSCLFIVNEETEEIFQKIRIFSIQQLREVLLKYKSMLKAAFLTISIYEDDVFKYDLEACKEMKDFFQQQLKIPCHFYTIHYSITFDVLVNANISSKINDEIILVNVEKKSGLRCKFFRFTSDGYKSTNQGDIDMAITEFAFHFLEETLKKSSIKKMILFNTGDDSTLLKSFEMLLRSQISHGYSNKIVAVDPKQLGGTATSGKTAAEMSKWFFDRSYCKFHVVPQISQGMEIVGVTGDCKKRLMLIGSDHFLPYTKSIIFNKSVQKCLMLIYYTAEGEVIKTLEVDGNCHQRKLTITIENVFFPEMKVEPIIIPAIKDFPTKLDNCKLKIPVIGFFRQSSVICVNEKGRYKFLDSWNGLYGKELFINFDHRKPKYGMDAIETDKTKMSFVVYDLIKIMSMPPGTITTNPNWKFLISKDSDNLVLLEFDNFDGTKKAASPAFLMALLLKEHLKVIKNELMLAEKPKEIGFCFFDKFTDAEMNRIKDGLKEACELLNKELICKFVEL